jgi:hypothetical protein
MQQAFNQKSSFSEAEAALRSWGIAYQKDSKGTITIPGDLDISNKNLTSLPDLSTVVVEGSVYCHDNALTSLAGSPETVYGGFNCSNNRLETLHGAPPKVETFICDDNMLRSLEGGPQLSEEGLYSCSRNILVTLKGAPEAALAFWCNNNCLTSLEYAPKTVGGHFGCQDNQLTSLAGGPVSVGGSFYCHFNQLSSLQGSPQAVGENFECFGNGLSTLEGAPATFKKIRSDFGDFQSWRDVPEQLRDSQAQLRLLAEERQAINGATVLEASLNVRGPLQLKR